MDAGADDGGALRARRERRRHQGADRREDQRGIEQRWRLLARAAGPFRAETQRKFLPSAVAVAGEGEDTLATMTRDLRDDMRRRAEAVDAEPLGRAGEAQRAVADEAGAEQRRCSDVVQSRRQRKAIARIGDRVLGIAAVDRIAGETRALAEILAPGAAIGARAAGEAEPGHADAHPRLQAAHTLAERLNVADDLMPGNQRQLGFRQLAVDDVEIGAADAASGDAQPHLLRTGLGQRQTLIEAQPLMRRREPHRAHRAFLKACCRGATPGGRAGAPRRPPSASLPAAARSRARCRCSRRYRGSVRRG
jgi:hypothetical protein